MDILSLFEDAFMARGNAVAVIASKAGEPAAVIIYANPLFVRLTQPGSTGLVGLPFTILQSCVENSPDWSTLAQAVAERTSLSLDMALVHGSQQSWFGFQLTFRHDRATKCSYGVIVGRDITTARRTTREENETRRLLAAVFLRISAAVTIVTADGSIIMANPAFQQLLGYAAHEIRGLNVKDLTAGEFKDAAQIARLQQLQDGMRYEMRLDTIGKSGTRIPVLLTSMLLHDGDQNLRVVTLLPLPASASQSLPEAAHGPPPARSIGQIEAISMSAFRALFGDEWKKVSVRALLVAEHVIRRRMDGADTLSRTDSGDFVIWFDSAGKDRNEAVVAGMVREIRLRFLADFGEDVVHHVSGVVVAATEASAAPLAEQVAQKRREASQSAAAFYAQLKANPEIERRLVMDRQGKTAAITYTDLAARSLRQMQVFEAAQPPWSRAPVDIDLVRCDIGVQEIGAMQGHGRVLIPISWGCLANLERRQALHEKLGRLGPNLRRHLMLAITEVTSAQTDRRWSDILRPLGEWVAEIGLMLRLEAADAGAGALAIMANCPVSLLVVDATAANVPPDLHFDLITNARQRSMAVLVRTATTADWHDWRELGATLLA